MLPTILRKALQVSCSGLMGFNGLLYANAICSPTPSKATSAAPSQSPSEDPPKQKKDADNSAKNARDKNKGTLTPLDQSSDATDIKITQSIRSELNKRKNISINLKNIKIITINREVTLLGPVATNEEKELAYKIAHKYAANGKVNNELEVK